MLPLPGGGVVGRIKLLHAEQGLRATVRFRQFAEHGRHALKMLLFRSFRDRGRQHDNLDRRR